MTIDVAAHKKQCELLPLETKSRLTETKAEQRHDYLIEEEKKISTQIRSVAATLHERIDLDKPTVEFLREHFYKDDPTLALAYFYCCSTDPRVAIFNNELQPDIDGSVIWNCISNLKQCFVKRHSTTLTNHMQELLPVHLVVNAF